MSALHNRTTPAKRLLTDIDAWCARTKSAETLIGRILFRHPGFVGMLRKRLTVTEEKEEQVRIFLETNPKGWDGKLPKCSGYGVTRPLLSSKLRFAGQGAATSTPSPVKPSERCIRIMRDAMENEVRKLEGYERFKLPDGVAEAARVDGRPITEFLSSLVWMGLECWKDDRVVHRERVR